MQASDIGALVRRLHALPAAWPSNSTPSPKPTIRCHTYVEQQVHLAAMRRTLAVSVRSSPSCGPCESNFGRLWERSVTASSPSGNAASFVVAGS
jgi:hypothetical protein